jgi:UDP-GlcNAc:undecaprenyl-phosphate/decaprenyl-phosphate GlcNAc-1-phosphate transferase
MFSYYLIKYFAVFSLSIITVILLTPLFIKLAPRIGLMDVPNERCIHKNITPVGGGLVIFIAFNITCYALYHYFGVDFNGLVNGVWWHAFFIASTILLIVGLIDDCFGMSPLVKLAGQALACFCLYVLSGYQVNLLDIDFGFFGGLIFVLIWTIAIINAFNLIDGLDGLCSGLSMISAAGLATIFILRGSSGDALVCLALIGACLGFLIYNFHPAKVFLGDTGSMFLGFSLASISLYAGGKGSFFVILAAPFFIAGIPVTDTLLAIWRRSIRKTLAERQGLPAIKVMQPDKEHLHHRLLNCGLKQHHVALVLYAVNILIVCIGLTFILFKDLAAGLFLIIFLITVYLLIKYVLHVELWEMHKLVRPSNKTPSLSRFSIIFYPSFDLLWMSISVLLANFIALSGEINLYSLSELGIQFPLWIMPIFILLFASKSYFKVWKSSFFRDYLFLLMAILVGSIISMALFFSLKIDDNILLLNKMSLFFLFSSIGIIGIRIIHYFIRAWGTDNANNANARHILIYGAGAYGVLYLHECYLKITSEPGTIDVIGFIDDNPVLRNQYVYGKMVLGGLSELTDLISTHSINEIIITTEVSNESFSQLKEIVHNSSIKLLKWCTLCKKIVA